MSTSSAATPPSRSAPTPPASTAAARIKESEYLLAAPEKQKARFTYGVMEKQFVRYYKEASRRQGKTGDNLLQLLECRLDNVVYRAGFARTRRQARQLVVHGHFLVNGKKVDIPSFQVTDHDIIDVREKSLEMTPFIVARETHGERVTPGVDGGHPVPDARPRAPGPGPRADRRAGPGAAHRRVLLQEVSHLSVAVRSLGRPPTPLFTSSSPPSSPCSGPSNSGWIRKGRTPCLSLSARPSPKRPSTSSARGSSSSPSSPASATRSATRCVVRSCRSIPGASVTSIKVDTVLHEFSTIEGVTEDVTEIILNLKGLVVSSEHDEPVVMYLRKSGAGDVTAADITPPAGVEVHNPELKIATLSDKGKLEMELVVERGRGYVSAVQNKGADNEIGRMPVDSIYSPVLKVTYKVEATRVEQRTDFDKLVIDVETKPSIRPRDAIASAGKTLVELFGLARELNVEAEGIDIGPSPVDEQLAADLALPVEDLQLTVRSYNCLKREGIHTVGELISRSEQDLLDIRNFGAKSIDEVKAKLVEMGLSLKDSAPGFDPHAALAAYGDDDDDAFVEDEQSDLSRHRSDH